MRTRYAHVHINAGIRTYQESEDVGVVRATCRDTCRRNEDLIAPKNRASGPKQDAPQELELVKRQLLRYDVGNHDPSGTFGVT